MKIELTRQQKTLYFYVFPCMMVLVIIAFSLIFSSGGSSNKKNDEKSINTTLPGTKSNLQEEKINAYKAEEHRLKLSSPKNESDFVLANYEILSDTSSKSPDVSSPEEEESQKPQIFPEKNNKGQTGKNKLSEAKHRLQEHKKRLDEFDGDEVYDEEQVQNKTKRSKSKPGKEQPAREITGEPYRGVSFNSITLEGSNSNQQNVNISGIPAFIHGDQTVQSGSIVKIRTGQELNTASGRIPANSFLYAKCILQAERLNLKVTQAQVGNNLYSINYTVYGTDGNIGIYVPGSVQKEENKKSSGKGLRRVGNALASGVNIVGGGVLGAVAESATEGVIDVVTDGSSKQIEQTRIFLPNNEKIYLK